jgi:hypothetical protein
VGRIKAVIRVLPLRYLHGKVVARYEVDGIIFLVSTGLLKPRRSTGPSHDLSCVEEAFLFDMTFFHPIRVSRTAQTIVILRNSGISVDGRRI